jgi:hypothetical protein
MGYGWGMKCIRLSEGAIGGRGVGLMRYVGRSANDGRRTPDGGGFDARVTTTCSDGVGTDIRNLALAW